MTRCHICKEPCVRELEPACGDLAAVTEPDVWHVVARNGLILEVNQACWQLWPDGHKHFPPVGFGRWPDEDRPRLSTVSLDDLVDVLRETA